MTQAKRKCKNEQKIKELNTVNARAIKNTVSNKRKQLVHF